MALRKMELKKEIGLAARRSLTFRLNAKSSINKILDLWLFFFTWLYETSSRVIISTLSPKSASNLSLPAMV